MEQYCGIPVVGSIPKDQDLRIMERHLGSFLHRNRVKQISGLNALAVSLSLISIWIRFCRLRELLRPLNSIPSCEEEENKKIPSPLGERDRVRGTAGTKKVRIGIIRDRAFNFYYPENLEALADEGAELIFINSFKDRLPQLDGLYIGGGFPEFFLKELEGNRGLREDIAEAVEEGLPVYAECAGLMYLCRSISWQNRSYEMVGVIPSEVQLSERPEGHGYVVAEVVRENPLFPVGLTIRGHEFHHSSLFAPRDLPVCLSNEERTRNYREKRRDRI